MDDLKFRRRVLSNPKQKDKEILDATAASEANSKFVDAVLDLDEKIKQAMTVEVPEDLADKILFSQTSSACEEKIAQPRFARKAMALAASIAFTAGLLVGQIQWANVLISPAQASLADTAIEHVTHEEAFIRHINEDVPSSQINAKLAPFNYQFSQHFPYHVYYLNHCGFGESNALHIVFQGSKGKVTLFVTSFSSEQSSHFNKQGMTGIIKPVGNSSLILVGEEGEDIAAIASTLAPIIRPM